MKRHFGLLIMALLLLAFAVPLAAQEEAGISLNLTPYEGNPILSVAETGAWDSQGVGMPRVVYIDGEFHMFYSGWNAETGVTSIGYATSEDGLTWTRFVENPVFVLEDAAARLGVLSAFPVFDGDTWTLYFTPSGSFSVSKTVHRATSPSPTGPWTVEPDPVLSTGAQTDWDSMEGLSVDTILRTDEGYVLYYTRMTGYSNVGPYYGGAAIGRAVSQDGVNWIKYDDPATTEAGFAASDPVFSRNPDGWDSFVIAGPVVRATDEGWEMFYYGSSGTMWSIGYATSEDGISWQRFGEDPILGAPGTGCAPGSMVVLDDTYYLYYGYYEGSTRTFEISVATGTVTLE